MTKKEVRKYVRNKEKTLSKSYFNEQKDLVINKLNKHPKFLKANKVGIYYPINNELDLLPLLKLYPNKKFYFPKTVKKNLEFKHIDDLSLLVKGPFNLKEPPKDLMAQTNIDLYLVPCVATYKNYRIGHGAGYYDYYFKTHKGYKIGIVLSVFKDLSTDIDEHDIPMDEII